VAGGVILAAGLTGVVDLVVMAGSLMRKRCAPLPGGGFSVLCAQTCPPRLPE
jgi:hypothetical protein